MPRLALDAGRPGQMMLPASGPVAPLWLVSPSLAPLRLAPLRLAPLRLAPLRLAPLRLAPL